MSSVCTYFIYVTPDVLCQACARCCAAATDSTEAACVTAIRDGKEENATCQTLTVKCQTAEVMALALLALATATQDGKGSTASKVGSIWRLQVSRKVYK